MSLSNRRTAAAAAIGVLAGGVPAGAASATPGHVASGAGAPTSSVQGMPENWRDLLPGTQHSDESPGPSADDAGGSAPPDGQADGGQCPQAAVARALPTVINCGPVTISITFNTVTTTTTITTVSAPITAANGPISTALPNPITTAVTNPLSNPAHRCRPAPKNKAKTTRPKRPVHKPKKAAQKVKIRVRLGPRASR